MQADYLGAAMTGFAPFDLTGYSSRNHAWPTLPSWGNWYTFHDIWRKAARTFCNPTVAHDEPLQKPDDIWESFGDINERYVLVASGGSELWIDADGNEHSRSWVHPATTPTSYTVG